MKKPRPSFALRRIRARALVARLLISLIVIPLIVISLVVIPLSAGGAFAAGQTAQSDETERLALFDDVWQTVGERYYDPSMHGLDWQRVRAEFRPLVSGAREQAEIYALLRRMLRRLGDPHTRVYAPDERAGWHEPRFITVGVGVRELDGEVLVSSLVKGSEAERAGVRVGDQVLRVDGVEAGELLSERLREESRMASFPAARLLAAARLFDGQRDRPTEVLFSSPAGRLKQLRLRRAVAVRQTLWRVRREDGRLGIVEFNAFTPETAAQLARALQNELRGARGLVLDLRGNGGGEAEAMTDLISAFLPEGTPLGRFTDRTGNVQSEPHTRARMVSTAAALERFDGALVLLTGAPTASAAEIFVAALRERERARVVGENTCGCVLGIRRRHTLADGGALDISETDYRTARGRRLEGTGIEPDELVTPTRRDLVTGRDAALARALALLKEQKRRSD